MFNSKKIEELERRIAALEPKNPYIETGIYATSTSTAHVDPVKDLQERVRKLEDEVMPDRDFTGSLFARMIYGSGREPKGLTLREKVSRICAHLKITFTTEPEKIVIKPVKSKRNAD